MDCNIEGAGPVPARIVIATVLIAFIVLVILLRRRRKA